MTSVKPEELLEEVRNYLDITWEDPDLDQKLMGIIARGMAYLTRWGGAGLDFKAEALPRALLLDYCRYVRSNAMDEFRANYLPELVGLQLEGANADDSETGAGL